MDPFGSHPQLFSLLAGTILSDFSVDVNRTNPLILVVQGIFLQHPVLDFPKGGGQIHIVLVGIFKAGDFFPESVHLFGTIALNFFQSILLGNAFSMFKDFFA